MMKLRQIIGDQKCTIRILNSKYKLLVAQNLWRGLQGKIMANEIMLLCGRHGTQCSKSKKKIAISKTTLSYYKKKTCRFMCHFTNFLIFLFQEFPSSARGVEKHNPSKQQSVSKHVTQSSLEVNISTSIRTYLY